MYEILFLNSDVSIVRLNSIFVSGLIHSLNIGIRVF